MIAIAFVVGSVFGSKVAIALPGPALRKVFAAMLAPFAADMFFHGPGS